MKRAFRTMNIIVRIETRTVATTVHAKMKNNMAISELMKTPTTEKICKDD